MLFSDLDGTLIFSRRALGLDGKMRDGAVVDTANLVAVEYLHGQPWSFVDRRVIGPLRALLQEQCLIPVTTRSVSQYRRVGLPGPRPQWAICESGGVILNRGMADPEHSKRVAQLVRQSCAPVEVAETLARHARATLGMSSGGTVRTTAGVVVRIQLPASTPLLAWAEETAAGAAALGWNLTLEARKAYITPAPMTKGWAAALLRDKLGMHEALAAGDSLLDLPLVQSADRSLVVAGSALAQLDLNWHSVGVTRGTGLAAGREIIEWASV